MPHTPQCMYCMFAFDECLLCPSCFNHNTPMQLTLNFVLFQLTHPPVRPQSAPEPSQHMCAYVSRMIQAYSGTITPFFSPINLPHSRSLVPIVPAPVPSSIPLQHPHTSQSSIQCPSCSPSVLSLPSSVQHPRQPPFPALIMFLSCFGLCTHPRITPRAYTTQYDRMQYAQHA